MQSEDHFFASDRCGAHAGEDDCDRQGVGFPGAGLCFPWEESPSQGGSPAVLKAALSPTRAKVLLAPTPEKAAHLRMSSLASLMQLLLDTTRPFSGGFGPSRNDFPPGACALRRSSQAVFVSAHRPGEIATSTVWAGCPPPEHPAAGGIGRCWKLRASCLPGDLAPWPAGRQLRPWLTRDPFDRPVAAPGRNSMSHPGSRSILPWPASAAQFVVSGAPNLWIFGANRPLALEGIDQAAAERAPPRVEA